MCVCSVNCTRAAVAACIIDYIWILGHAANVADEDTKRKIEIDQKNRDQTQQL